LKIPTDFRRVLEDRHGTLDLFVTSVEGDSAQIYPLPVWEALEAKLAALPSTHPVRRRFQERVSYYGQQAQLDVQGRILIPQLLREKAGMNGDVVVMGELDHLVVWNHDRFLARLTDQPFTEDDYRALSDLGI
jgi:MraZ protein